MVQLYYTDAAALSAEYERALALLPPERRERTERCRFPAARCRMAAAGLLLRAVLGIDKDGLLQSGEYGKPYLPNGPQFSLSHGGDLAVLAVDTAGAVGVDAEPCGRSMQGYYLAGVLTPDELARCNRPNGERFAWFWTRKEAVMKASGLGLRLTPTRIDTLHETASAQGETYFLQTLLLDGHFVSVASLTAQPPAITCLPTQTLLSAAPENPFFVC